MRDFVNQPGLVKYLNANKIAYVPQALAKACHPDLTRDELMHFTSHLGRVWAVVMPTDFIRSRLCWLGESYRLYLQDTAILQQKYIFALEKALIEFMLLFSEYLMMLPDIVPADTDMNS
jgi:hypothetical protein